MPSNAQPPRRNRFIGDESEAEAWAAAFEDAQPTAPPPEFTPEELTAAMIRIAAEGNDEAAKKLAKLAKPD